MFGGDDDQSDGFLLHKMALDVDDAGGQETGFGDESAMSAFVDEDGAVSGDAMQEPERAVTDGFRIG